MSLGGAVNLLVYVIIIVILIVVLIAVLRWLGVFFIAPIVSATPMAYTETIGQVSLSEGLSQSLIADTSQFYNI
jgi:hypothetical protein